jgi:hypothetical protein
MPDLGNYYEQATRHQEEIKGSSYLGDGLYAIFADGQIELFASNGLAKTNQVYLEPQVLANFEAYVAALKAKLAE